MKNLFCFNFLLKFFIKTGEINSTKFKKLLPILVLLIVLLSLGAVAASEDVGTSTEIDNNVLSEAQQVNYADDSFSALNELIQAEGNESTLDHNYKYNATTDDAFVDGIVIDKDLIINGNNTVIDGINVARIFNITNSNLTLNDLTLQNGYASVGGAIYSSNNVNLTCNNVNFTGNNASKYGGAIYAVNDVFINATGDVIFKDNTVCYSGGPIYSNGVDIDAVGDVSFINNNANTYGGALYLSKRESSVNNVTFIGNKAKNGSAIYVHSNAVLSINDCYADNTQLIYDKGTITNATLVVLGKFFNN